MMASLKALVLYLADKYGIPLTRAAIIGHNEVPDPADPTQFGGANHHTDPGVFPWPQFMASLSGAA
jgi:hypothetical protein